MSVAVTPPGTGSPPTKKSKRSQQARNKSWGYSVEVLALHALQILFPDLERTGASAQKTKGYPDLASPSRGGSMADRKCLPLVVTKDKGRHRPLLVTLRLEDLIQFATHGVPQQRVAVQVKGRASSTIGSLFEELEQVGIPALPQTSTYWSDEQQQQSEARG